MSFSKSVTFFEPLCLGNPALFHFHYLPVLIKCEPRLDSTSTRSQPHDPRYPLSLLALQSASMLFPKGMVLWFGCSLFPKVHVVDSWSPIWTMMPGIQNNPVLVHKNQGTIRWRRGKQSQGYSESHLQKARWTEAWSCHQQNQMGFYSLGHSEEHMPWDVWRSDEVFWGMGWGGFLLLLCGSWVLNSGY